MDLSQSREDEDKKMTESMRVTNASTAFKCSGRETKANWANRFCKDFNDLNYDIKYDLIKGKANLNARKFYQNQIKHRRKSYGSKDPHKKGHMDKCENIKKLMRMNKTVNPEKYCLGEEKHSSLASQGLSKFQYEKTIAGKLVYKSNHHLNFKYQTARSSNENPVWYDSNRNIDLQKMFRTISKKKIAKCHDFNSYSPRRVFEPKEELDKFYNTRKGEMWATSRTIRQTVRIDGIVGRADPKQKQSSKLHYNEYEARIKFSRRPESHQICRGKRELQFSRQVISPERGCYR